MWEWMDGSRESMMQGSWCKPVTLRYADMLTAGRHAERDIWRGFRPASAWPTSGERAISTANNRNSPKVFLRTYTYIHIVQSFTALSMEHSTGSTEYSSTLAISRDLAVNAWNQTSTISAAEMEYTTHKS